MEKSSMNKEENMGWMVLAEKSIKEIWDNEKDEEVWYKYLFQN
jgi:hypothetical protein